MVIETPDRKTIYRACGLVGGDLIWQIRKWVMPVDRLTHPPTGVVFDVCSDGKDGVVLWFADKLDAVRVLSHQW